MRDASVMEIKPRKLTEKFERDPDVAVEKDVYKKTFYYAANEIKYTYHHQPGRITRCTRMFTKTGELRVDALEGEPIKRNVYDELKKMPKVLEEEMKECFNEARDTEQKVKSLLKARARDERKIVDIHEALERGETADELRSPWASVLDEDMYDMVRKRIAEGALDDAGGDDKAELFQERDYLKPYLPPNYAPGDDTVRLQRDEAINVKDQCLKALKDRLIERANIIQSRLDGENAILARKQAAFQRARDHATPEQEEEYEEFCAEAWFRIQILEQRLARHEDQALQKFAELDTKLRNDPRLGCLLDFP